MPRAKSPTGTTGFAPKLKLAPDQIERGIQRLQDRITELRNFDASELNDEGDSPKLSALSAAIKDTLERCFGENTSVFDRLGGAATLHFFPGYYSHDYPLRQHYVTGTQNNIQQSILMLAEAQRTLREDLADHVLDSEPEPTVSPKTPILSRRVFVVHGHDDAALQGLARFLEKLGLEAIILKEQPDQGRTIIEKFEDSADDVGFAVVLLTPDDLAKSAKSDIPDPRARQNVIFELGFFAGKLGRGRVCLLRKGHVEIPSDLYGVIYTEMDSADGWQTKLVKELKAAKLDFDANKLWQ